MVCVGNGDQAITFTKFCAVKRGRNWGFFRVKNANYFVIFFISTVIALESG